MQAMRDPSSNEADQGLWHRWRPWLIVFLATFATLALLALALVVLPPLLMPGGRLGPPAPQAVPSVRPSPSPTQSSPVATPASYADVNNALSAARGNLVAALGVLAVAIGGVVGFLNLRETQWQNRETARQSRDALEVARQQNRETLDLARRGQVTERFSRAIDQLGESGDDKVDVRIGAIYSLEQIARESPDEYHGPIMDTLTAFLRSHSLPLGPAAADENVRLRADFQTIARVLGRRNVRRDTRSLDLSGVDLRNAVLADAHLEGALLYGAHLERANLGIAHLQDAFLTATHLEHAFLIAASMERVTLAGTHLEGADLTGVRLEDARAFPFIADFEAASGREVHVTELASVHLQNAILAGAHLEGASLVGANLEGAWLTEAHLERADLRNIRARGGARFDGGSTGGCRIDLRRRATAAPHRVFLQTR